MFLWMLMAWYRPTAWTCVFTKGHYSEAAGMSLFVETSPLSSLWLARQPTSKTDGSVIRYLLTAPKESVDIRLFLQGKGKGKQTYGRGRTRGTMSCVGPFVRDWTSAPRPVWERGYSAMGSCLDGRGAEDIWVVTSGGRVVIAVRSEDGRVALCQVAPNMIPSTSCRSGAMTPEVRVWSGDRRGWSWCYSYANRIDVPRAKSIEAVLLMKNQIAIYYTTRDRDVVHLWRVDNEQRRFPYFLATSDAHVGPTSEGKGGKKRTLWTDRWGVASSPADIPPDFFGDRPGAIAFLAQDGGNVENGTEVWRTQIRKNKYTHPDALVTHFRCTPPNPQQYEMELGGTTFLTGATP
eukprot:GEMP01022637.1.p1 GENE.GEMP01022637.1~~GEMP01022637.1.p1  ORF type:complete len:349 (+),score=79.30 GEMP01022637.1:980-2026(+)